MLLVDHDKPEFFERDFVLNHSVRADDHVDVTAGDLFVQRRAGFAFDAPDQQADFDAKWTQECVERLCVLPRKNFSRRHEGGLVAVTRSLTRREARHHCLARADIALKQSVHRHFSLKILQNIPGGTFLRAGEGKRQFLDKCAHRIDLKWDMVPP